MIIWGLPIVRINQPMRDAYGVTYQVNTITNAAALRHFGARIPLPVNDNHVEISA